MRIDGSVVAITGGASGLGLATARSILQRGGRVALLDLPTSAGLEVAAELGERAVFAPADILDDAAVNSAFDAAQGLGTLRGVVHCAGRGGDRLRILDREGIPADFQSFENVIRINLFGTYNILRLGAARLAVNDIADGDRGTIVLTASVAAFDGQIGQTAYAASKAAVHGMTLVAARDLASRQIRVNTIAPGTFDTPMLARLRADIRKDLENTVPHPKRLGGPEDYAHLAVAILENSYLNGETIRLDGAIRMPPR
ncbi:MULTISPECIES: SDR family NAD(P)-dependent oxidoreductase [unclassified Microbacterium]|uniref:SDR family NAD(P)-dependent oxidoreductase n=1 Tax=unclassified Microbacterium TaxID=2609290 RepID=UPI00214AD2E0|nr:MULTISPECIES: SDR family NAD(P)-dependent oxidoreductase [unclassified Microbacterium]MCR2811382.1 SDR family NAD(P)-dependent oxidoreductase [Microbacterium sp. zg.B185]WIM19572.1 SDR family NAD(P)-dependent oxidoreductase [Microbacterium sp. zg-B185]